MFVDFFEGLCGSTRKGSLPNFDFFLKTFEPCGFIFLKLFELVPIPIATSQISKPIAFLHIR